MSLPAHRIAAGLLALGLLGCLRAFGPDLRPKGAHLGLPGDSPDATCMGCHESEAEALARMNRTRAGDDPVRAMPESPPGSPEDRPPLVADWMIAEPQPCTACHRIHEGHG